jgi:hypothetical protein
MAFSAEVLAYMQGIPCVRRQKVAEMRRLLAADSWHPESESVAEMILLEHLAESEPVKPSTSPEPDS